MVTERLKLHHVKLSGNQQTALRASATWLQLKGSPDVAHRGVMVCSQKPEVGFSMRERTSNTVMNTIWSATGSFELDEYANEADLEKAVQQVQHEMFGRGRIYLEVKRLIGKKGGKQNIPDGYLIDLSERKPKLFVVENELANHHLLKHIAVQILEFSLAFESEPRLVRTILLDALIAEPAKLTICNQYAHDHRYRNLDHLLDDLVHSPFQALVIIDRVPDGLVNVLSRKFAFGVEVLELRRYANQAGSQLFLFDAFLKGIEADLATPSYKGDSTLPTSTSELDTVVVPAREDGFEEVFLRENRWYQVRIHGTMRPQIKHVAVYQVAPVSAITHIAPVASIEPWADSAKFVLNFAEPARSIGPIPLVPRGRVKAPQNLRYTSLAKLQSAKNLDDVW